MTEVQIYTNKLDKNLKLLIFYRFNEFLQVCSNDESEIVENKKDNDTHLVKIFNFLFNSFTEMKNIVKIIRQQQLLGIQKQINQI